LDLCITDKDQPTYNDIISEKGLERQAKEKRDLNLDVYVKQRHSFAPLVYSVDEMAAKEAPASDERIASLLAAK
jgi:hypothetical protein